MDRLIYFLLDRLHIQHVIVNRQRYEWTRQMRKTLLELFNETQNAVLLAAARM